MNELLVKAEQVVTGYYKRPGRPGSTVSLEVNATFKIMNNRGVQVNYLLGTRLDGDAKGQIVSIRADGFDPRRVAVTEAEGFKQLEDIEMYHVSSNGFSPWFNWVEKVTPGDEDFAHFADMVKLSEVQTDGALVMTV